MFDYVQSIHPTPGFGTPLPAATHASGPTKPTPPPLYTFDPSTLGTNPWNATLGADTQAAQTQTQGAQLALGGLNSQITAMGGTPPGAAAPSSYPAMPNSFGLGGPVSSTPSAGQAPSAPTATALPTTGLNPWSLTGEANTR
jgi:hypothetical protein